MARQILDLFPQPSERLNDRMMNVQTNLAEIAVERLLRIHPLEVIDDLRQPIDLRRFERQRLPDFPRGAAAAIGDDIRRHGDARPDWRPAVSGVAHGVSVLRIEMLNRAL